MSERLLEFDMARAVVTHGADPCFALEGRLVPGPRWQTDILCGSTKGSEAHALSFFEPQEGEWLKHLRDVVNEFVAEKKRRIELFGLHGRVQILEQQLATVTKRLAAPENGSVDEVSEFTVYVISFAPKPFIPITPIPLLVQSMISEDSDDLEYVARFVEASVGSTGSTIDEAVNNAKDRLLTKFNFLDRMPAEKLGKGPKQQLAVLRSVMKRVENAEAKQDPDHETTGN